MRLLVLTDRYPPLYEGAYEINCKLAIDGLRERGHEAIVLTTQYGLQHPRVEDGVYRILHFHDFAYQNKLDRRLSQLSYAFQSRANYRMASRVAASVQPDLVFSWHMLTASILPIIATQDLGLKPVLQLSSHWLIQLKERMVDDPNPRKRLYHRALNGFRRWEELDLQRVIMTSQSLRDSYVQAGMPLETSLVLPAALPDTMIADEPAPRPNGNGMIRLVFAGRLTEEKGVHVAVQAIAALTRRGLPNVSLDIYGAGRAEYTDRLRALIAANDLSEQVRLAGFVPQRELVPRFQEYDAMLLPSLQWEGLPSTMIEAMAQGVPVIGSDIGGPRDAIIPGQTGMLVPPGDPQALAAAIEELQHRPERLGEWGRCCIEYIRQHHSLEQMIDQYESALKRFLTA